MISWRDQRKAWTRGDRKPIVPNRFWVVSAALALGLAACSELQPVPLKAPGELLNAPDAFSTQPSFEAQISDTLLDLFDDAILRAAVDQALEHNLDILQSAKQLELAGIGLTTTAADAPRNVTITVNFSGASPEDAEEGAAIKVEQALNGLQGVKEITSTITADAAVTTVQGIKDYPLAQLKSDIKDRVDAITSFPAQVESTTIALEQEERHVIYVQLMGGQDHATLKEVARRVRETLLALPAVSKVTTEGARTSEITVELQEEKLRAYGLTFEEVAQAVQDRSISLSAGTLQSDRGSLNLQSRNQAYFGSDLLETRIRVSAEGGVVRLSDVAQVIDDFTEDAILSIYKGQPSIRLDVQLIGKDSITQTSDAVQAKLAELQTAPWMPRDLTIESWRDEAQSIRDRLALMSKNALTGMALVFIMLALFLDLISPT